VPARPRTGISVKLAYIDVTAWYNCSGVRTRDAWISAISGIKRVSTLPSSSETWLFSPYLYFRIPVSTLPSSSET